MRDMFFAKGRHRPVHFKRWDAASPYKTERPERKDRLGVERKAKPRPKRPPSAPIKLDSRPAEPWLFLEGHWYASLAAALEMILPPEASRSVRPNLTWEIAEGPVWIGRFELVTGFAGSQTFLVGVRAERAQALMAELLD